MKLLLLPFALAFAMPAMAQLALENYQCDVVIVGGSTAALSAALTSARDGADTCLLEPFNQAGGQLLNTPAIDHAWHTATQPTAAHQLVKSGDVDKLFDNQPPGLRDWLTQLGGVGNPQNCWVAGNDDCFLPVHSSFPIVGKAILPDLIGKPVLPAMLTSTGALNRPNLRVFYNTVLRASSVTTTTAGMQKITALTATKRIATTGASAPTMDGFDRPLSEEIASWYSTTANARWNKAQLTFTGKANGLIVIDASEFGDVLATSQSSYLVGTETATESDLTTAESCGQAFVFSFFMKYKKESGAAVENAPQWQSAYPADFKFGANDSGKAFSWTNIWSYRRVYNGARSNAYSIDNNTYEYKVAELGDTISLQNWTTGNDYSHRSLFLSKSDTAAQVATGWSGGLNLVAMAEAEKHAIGWYYWFKNKTPASSAARITIGTEITGTFSGLTRFPYLRSTRRSVGLNNFKLITADFQPESTASKTGRVFSDRVALSNYALDIHPITTAACSGATLRPVTTHPYPYYIPFRALTNAKTENLLVAGKTIAQSFWVSTSTRLQPEEYAQGQAAGAAASWMTRNTVKRTQDALGRITEVQATTKLYTPNNWTF
jgi:hypothetical protein